MLRNMGRKALLPQRISIILKRCLRYRKSEEMPSENLNYAEESFEDFIEDVAVHNFGNGEECSIVSCLWRVP